jgi:hypothetical protein
MVLEVLGSCPARKNEVVSVNKLGLASRFSYRTPNSQGFPTCCNENPNARCGSNTGRGMRRPPRIVSAPKKGQRRIVIQSPHRVTVCRQGTSLAVPPTHPHFPPHARPPIPQAGTGDPQARTGRVLRVVVGFLGTAKAVP